jgi:hypothetical protein
MKIILLLLCEYMRCVYVYYVCSHTGIIYTMYLCWILVGFSIVEMTSLWWLLLVLCMGSIALLIVAAEAFTARLAGSDWLYSVCFVYLLSKEETWSCKLCTPMYTYHAYTSAKICYVCHYTKTRSGYYYRLSSLYIWLAYFLSLRPQL